MALTKITSEIIESNLTLTGTADGSTTPLTVKNTSTNGASEARLEFNQGGTSHGYITSSYNSNSPYMAFSVGSGSSEKARIDSSGHLIVGGTSASATVLDGTGAAGCVYIGNSSQLYPVLALESSQRSHLLYQDSSGNLQIWDSTSNDVRLGINTSGAIGMGGDPDTTHRLTLKANATITRCLNMQTVNSGTCAITQNVSGTGAYNAFLFLLEGGNSQKGSIAVGAGGTSFNTSSDYRLKENVDYTWDATTRLKQLRPARFNWIADDTDTLVDGFLAHEVEDIVPESVTGTKDATETLTNVVRSAQGAVLSEGVTEAEWTAGKEANDPIYPSDSTWDASLTKDVYQQIDQAKLVPLLVKTIQELEARITTLENA